MTRPLARHALGLPNTRRQSYRNSYYAVPGSPTHAEWLAMIAAGDAAFAPFIEGRTASTGFCLTRQGAEAALAPGESLDPEDFPEEVAS